MHKRAIAKDVFWLGAIDWDRRLFDSLIPLPDGTTYNAYLVRGRDKTALLDAVDPAMAQTLLDQLAGVPRLDYIVSQHAEQDHSGSIPLVLARYPEAQVLATPKATGLLSDMLHLPGKSLRAVADGETLDLGGRTLQFLHTPWVHWPETMCSWLEEEGILFSCDFFGSHIAGSELLVTDRCRVEEAARRYFAEIMMPFRNIIEKNLDKLQGLDIRMIAPSHGQIYGEPAWILEAYRQWVSGPPRNLAVIPYVSMHQSTRIMAERLAGALVRRGVRVELFNLAVTDIGKLAMALIDAATVVIGAPTVLAGPHPLAAYAAFLANALRPKARFVSIVGSYGWGGKTVEVLAGMIPNLKAEVLPPVLCKGLPREADLEALDGLAEAIAGKHAELGLA